VVNISLDFGIEKLVHFSSISALGRTKEKRKIDENSAWQRNNLNSNYSISKYLAEQEVWRGIAEGLPAAILNPSVVIGSGVWNSGTAVMFREVWNGLKFYPTGATGFVDVRDVALIAIKLMESELLEERFLINNENISYQEFFSRIAQKLGKKPPAIKVSPLMKGLAWRLDWLRSTITGSRHLITRETANLVSRSFYYDNAKSVETFGYRYIPLEKTISDTASQFIESQKQGKPYNFLPLV
jgi:nucleoside-diphosphate-sugar epimerase